VKAPVALEEFGDFQCLPCSLLWPVLKQLESDYGDRLSVTFRENPLSMHEHAIEAARAAEAAGLQNRFWEMHDLLYQNRRDWIVAIYPPKFFIEYASTLGLDAERFKKDMESEKVAARIAADKERGASLEIDRTPVVFVNGERVPKTAKTVEGLHAVIDAALGINPP
jgi:protein-disulfide isomerase